MPSNADIVTQTRGHVWTKFEIHTLLCLMIRNIHIRGLPVTTREQKGTGLAADDGSRKSKKKRADLPHVSKRSAHMDVATALNRALNGRDISQDIDHLEISAMIDKIAIEKKGTLAVVQRQKPKRMTRLLKQVLRRNIRFIGDREEWMAGRKEEIEKLESERTERKFAMAMAGVGGAAEDGFGENNAAASFTEDSHAVDLWGDKSDLTPVEKQNAIHWGGAGAATSAGNQTAVEVGWGAGQTTPEEYRPSLSTGFDDEAVQPVLLADADNTGWASGYKTARLTDMGADDLNADWGGGTAASVPTASSADPWSSNVAPTVETPPAIAKDHSADFPSADDSPLSISLATAPASPTATAADQGINLQRLVMLQEQEASETSLFVSDANSDDDEPIREDQRQWMPRGGNALPLPFNRLVRRNQMYGTNVLTDQSDFNGGASPDIKMEATTELNKQGGEIATDLGNGEG